MIVVVNEFHFKVKQLLVYLVKGTLSVFRNPLCLKILIQTTTRTIEALIPLCFAQIKLYKTFLSANVRQND